MSSHSWVTFSALGISAPHVLYIAETVITSTSSIRLTCGVLSDCRCIARIFSVFGFNWWIVGQRGVRSVPLILEPYLYANELSMRFHHVPNTAPATCDSFRLLLSSSISHSNSSSSSPSGFCMFKKQSSNVFSQRTGAVLGICQVEVVAYFIWQGNYTSRIACIT